MVTTRKERASAMQRFLRVDPDARVFEFLTFGLNGRWGDATDSAFEGRMEIANFDGLVLILDELWH
jgi:hypothetical protein